MDPAARNQRKPIRADCIAKAQAIAETEAALKSIALRA